MRGMESVAASISAAKTGRNDNETTQVAVSGKLAQPMRLVFDRAQTDHDCFRLNFETALRHLRFQIG
jgi:hypothetical protein